jgi:5-oxoprolinase (ATP-hydrolysing) subunit A
MAQIDLNCDIGESIGGQFYDLQKDLAILPYISSVNIACGQHAGDAYTMHSLVEAALEKGIAVGAHPSYPDAKHFGRKEMSLTPSQVYDLMLYQLGALHAFVHAKHFGRKEMSLTPSQVYDLMLYQLGALHAFVHVYGSRLHHVKPHGALYNSAARDKSLADAIALAIAEFDKQVILYGLSGSELITAGKEHGIRTCSEVFADRSYQRDGSLTPRDHPGAVITDLNISTAQVLMMIKQGSVRTAAGDVIPIVAETICIHGDHLHAAQTAAAISESLKKADVVIQQP